MADSQTWSPIGRLLEEISWEGNARKYRDGGRGKENVLTAEVFGALDMLPRDWFLAQVLTRAHGADEARASVASQAERARIEVLVGDLRAQQPDGSDTLWSVQPDATIESDATFCLVEAKRIRTPASFQQHQMARSLATCLAQAGGRTPLLLLVLGEPPPLYVRSHDRMTIAQAVELGAPDSGAAPGRLRDAVPASISWTTWSEIRDALEHGIRSLEPMPDPAAASIVRMASAAVHAIDWHS